MATYIIQCNILKVKGLICGASEGEKRLGDDGLKNESYGKIYCNLMAITVKLEFITTSLECTIK